MANAWEITNGKTINKDWEHSGAVDWEGNIYIIERDAHRIVKVTPKMDKFLMQIGTTMEKGNGPNHLDLPSGIAVLKSGNIVVTDGYGNNRVILYDKNGKFIKQVGKGAGGPADKGTGPGEWVLPHKLAVDAQENLYIIDRENKRLQVFDKDLMQDDPIDINRIDPKRNLDFVVNTRTCRIEGMAQAYRCGQPVVRAGGERKDLLAYPRCHWTRPASVRRVSGVNR